MAAKNPPAAKPVAYKRGAALVLPTLSIATMEEGDSIFVEIVAPPVTRPQYGKDKKVKVDPDTQEPLSITTCRARDLNKNVTGDIVLGYMVLKGLQEKFPSPEDMVGHKFEFLKGPKKNRTILWEVYELEDA